MNAREPIRLTAALLADAAEDLARRDPLMRRALDVAGMPRLGARSPGFHTLVRVICSQQVSVAAARTIDSRLEATLGQVTPAAVRAAGPRPLRAAGLSGRKTEYVLGLADAIEARRLSLRRVARLPDEPAIAELIQIRGIGRWTAEIYLMFALRRPDLWPVDDLAVVSAYARLRGSATRPGRDEMIELGAAWRPWRSVAARLLWQFYLHAPPV